MSYMCEVCGRSKKKIDIAVLFRYEPASYPKGRRFFRESL